MSRYSYEECLQRSYQVNWRLDEVLDGRRFDPEREWLPRSLSAADSGVLADPEELRRLTHVEMAAYAHLFGYAEEFITPSVVEMAHQVAGTHKQAFDALTNFAAEEVKHMTLFRMLRDQIDGQFGFQLERIGDQEQTTRYVTGKHRGAVLLLIACIEWFTQRHYLECFEDDDDLDPFTRHIFRCHWLEESQHAQMDHLETLRAMKGLDAAERDTVVDDLIELVSAFDGLLQQQATCDLANLRRALSRPLARGEAEDLEREILRAKRHTFLETGLTHPRFIELLEAVTTAKQRERLGLAAAQLAAA